MSNSNNKSHQASKAIGTPSSTRPYNSEVVRLSKVKSSFLKDVYRATIDGLLKKLEANIIKYAKVATEQCNRLNRKGKRNQGRM